MAKVVQIQVEINGIRGAVNDTDSLKKAIRATNKELDQVEFGTAKYKRLQDQLGGLRAVQKQVRADTRKSQQAFEAAAQSGTGSYRALNAQLVKLRNEFKDLSEVDRNSEVGQRLVKQIAELDTELKSIDRTIGQFQRNVGNYGEFILGASKKQEQLVRQLEMTRQEFNALPRSIRESAEAQAAFTEITSDLENQIADLGKVTGKTSEDYKKGFLDNLSQTEGAAGNAVRGVKGLSAGFKALLANPVVATISLIVAGLSALGGAFAKSERGAGLLAKAGAVLNGIMSEIVGIANSAVDSIVAFANDPIQGLKDLGQAIIDNVVNRFKGFIDILRLSGQAIGQLVSGQFGQLKDTAQEAGRALIQLGTGLDATQQRDFAKAVGETTSEIEKNIGAWAKLGEARRAIFRQNLELQKQLEGITTSEQLLSATADDTTKSFKEREEAATAARRASEARAAKELEIARNNLSLVNQELRLRQANGEAVDNLLQDQLSAFQAVASAERDLTLTIRDNERTRAELKQDRLERDLDILIDGFDNQKTINERLLQDDRITLQERQRLFEQTQQLADESFQKQIETIQQFTGVQLEANKLIAESDAVRLNEQIRSLGLSEIIEGRLLEIIRERRLAVQDLNEAQADLNAEAAQVPIQQIEAARDMQIAALVEIAGVAADLSSEREIIEQRANQSIIEQRLATEQLSANDRAALELELAETITAIRRSELDKRVNDEVKAIERRRDEQLKALFDQENGEQVSAQKIAAIRLAAETEILQARLNLDQLSADERLAIELELQQARVSANNAANAQAKEGIEGILGVIEFGLQGLESIRSAFSSISDARLNKERQQIDALYDYEVEQAQGNADEITRINEERDSKIAEIEKEAFERQKRLQIAQALISGAQAVVSTLAAVPGFVDVISLATFRALQIGFVTATTAAQIAAISSQQFEGAEGLLIPSMAEGGSVTMHSRTKGRTHASGHIYTSFHNQPVKVENGEFVTQDETGAAVVINRRSSDQHLGLLRRISKKRFPGKRALLSAINVSGGGIPFAEDGAMIQPNLTGFYRADAAAAPDASSARIVFTSDQMQMLAQAVASGAMAGTEQGVVNGSSNAQRMNERRENLQSRIS